MSGEITSTERSRLNFERAQAVIKEFEGGFVDDPKDPDAATNFGITHTTLAKWRGTPVTKRDVLSMSYDEAKDIYFTEYWSKCSCGSMPGPLALPVYNVAVHAGPGTAGLFLRRALNQNGATLKSAGMIDDDTLIAVAEAPLPSLTSDFIDLYESKLRAHPAFVHFKRTFLGRVAKLRIETEKWLAETGVEAPGARSIGLDDEGMSVVSAPEDLIVELRKLVVAYSADRAVPLETVTGHQPGVAAPGSAIPEGRADAVAAILRQLLRMSGETGPQPESGPLDEPVSGTNFSPNDETGQRMNVWISDNGVTEKLQLLVHRAYVLNFRVGEAVDSSLIGGPIAFIPSSDIPEWGLDTDWVVVTRGCELAPLSPETKVTVEMIEGARTWSARFPLRIPRSGNSELRQFQIKPLHVDPVVDVVVTVRNELYRQFKIRLSVLDKPIAVYKAPVRVESDVMPTVPEHSGLSPPHEWTTPNDRLSVTVIGPQAVVAGNINGNQISSSIERWIGVQARVAGPIKNVRVAAEILRATWEDHLNNIPADDLSMRLEKWGKSHNRKTQWGGPEYSWSALQDWTDQAHHEHWSRMARSKELRNLAERGRQLFISFFPKTNADKLHDWLASLPPGARLDMSWTPAGGPGYVPHVPWGLMFTGDIPPEGQAIDPMGFLGLRCRIAYTSHESDTAFRSLGSPADTHRANLLYWSTGQNDTTGQEASWQRTSWKRWNNQIFIPGTLQNPKAELLAALEQPGPTPMSVLYLFCQCNTGAGNDPVLRFGSTNAPADTVEQSDLGSSPLTDRPFVFANACTTASADPYMANALEEAFFNRNCRAYLGTETKVPIVLGSRFASIFFHFFYRELDPEPMAAGEAVSQAKLFLWTHYRNIGGLFYCHINQYDLFMATREEVGNLRS